MILFSVFLLAALSGLYTALEVALLQTDRQQLGERARRGEIIAKRIEGWLGKPTVLFATINLFNQASASLVSYWIHHGGFTSWQMGISDVGFTLFILVFAEGVPKALALRRPDMLARLAPSWLDGAGWVLRPLISFFSWLPRVLGGGGEGLSKVYRMRRDEVRSVLGQALSARVRAPESTRILGLLSLREIPLSACMVGTEKVITVGPNLSRDEVIARIKETGHSRLPFIFESLDDSRTYLHAKSLLKAEGDWKAMLQPLETLPYDTPLSEALEMMRVGPALVLVEKEGERVGAAFLEDILERALGTMGDEYDGVESI